MAEALILDSEALNALARPSGRGVLLDRAMAILKIAYDRRALVRVSGDAEGWVPKVAAPGDHLD